MNRIFAYLNSIAACPQAAPRDRRLRAADRRHPAAALRPERRMGALLRAGLRRQGAHRLRPRCRLPALLQRDACPGERHHRGQGDADRGRRHLRLHLGYYDFGWWARLDEAACRIVTRLKVNTRLAGIEERPLPLEPGAILSDRIGFLPERQAHSRQNPMAQAVREVRVSTESGMVLRLLTSDLDAPAEEIAALYRRRWAIELFFRWVKQMLRIGHFYATSESAVAIQVTVALIAFVLLKLAHAAQGAVESLTQFARLVGAGRVKTPPPVPPPGRRHADAANAHRQPAWTIRHAARPTRPTPRSGRPPVGMKREPDRRGYDTGNRVSTNAQL